MKSFAYFLVALLCATTEGALRPSRHFYTDLINEIRASVVDANKLFAGKVANPFSFEPLPGAVSRWNQPIYSLKFQTSPSLPNILLVGGIHGSHQGSTHAAIVFIEEVTHWLARSPFAPPVLENVTQRFSFEIIVAANPDAIAAFAACPEVMMNTTALSGNLLLNPSGSHPDAAAWDLATWQSTGCSTLRQALAPNAPQVLRQVDILNNIGENLANREPESKAIAFALGLSAGSDGVRRATPAGVVVIGGADTLPFPNGTGIVAYPPTRGSPRSNAWWLQALSSRLGRVMASRHGRNFDARAQLDYRFAGVQDTPCDALAATSALCLTVTQPGRDSRASAAEATWELADEIIAALLDVANILDTDYTKLGSLKSTQLTHYAAVAFGIDTTNVLLEQMHDMDQDGVADVFDVLIRRGALTANDVTLRLSPGSASSSGLVFLIFLIIVTVIVGCTVAIFYLAPCCKVFHKTIELPRQAGGGVIVVPNIPTIRSAAYDPFGLHKARNSHNQMQDDGSA